MHDLIALLLGLASLAAWRAYARLRPLPRMYGGGVDIADQPPTGPYGRQP